MEFIDLNKSIPIKTKFNVQSNLPAIVLNERHWYNNINELNASYLFLIRTCLGVHLRGLKLSLILKKSI
jgi:hypothetical protein